jgi:hypothetical protein
MYGGTIGKLRVLFISIVVESVIIIILKLSLI